MKMPDFMFDIEQIRIAWKIRHAKKIEHIRKIKEQEGYKFFVYQTGDYERYKVYFRHIESARAWIKKHGKWMPSEHIYDLNENVVENGNKTQKI
jgi:penicillin-binding protein-related factor A (putative recombinase)